MLDQANQPARERTTANLVSGSSPVEEVPVPESLKQFLLQRADDVHVLSDVEGTDLLVVSYDNDRLPQRERDQRAHVALTRFVENHDVEELLAGNEALCDPRERHDPHWNRRTGNLQLLACRASELVSTFPCAFPNPLNEVEPRHQGSVLLGICPSSLRAPCSVLDQAARDFLDLVLERRDFTLQLIGVQRHAAVQFLFKLALQPSLADAAGHFRSLVRSPTAPDPVSPPRRDLLEF